MHHQKPKLLQEIEVLPPELQKQVSDFIATLKTIVRTVFKSAKRDTAIL